MIDKLQKEIGDWYNHNFAGSLTTGEQLLVVTEELGELAHAYVKDKQGIRTGIDYHSKKIDAVGDIFISLVSYCNAEGISMEDAIRRTWEQVKQRDWKANPKTGEVPNAPGGAIKRHETIKEVVDAIFDSLIPQDKNTIASAKDIGSFHHTAGMNIRNSFELWHLKEKNPSLYADCCRIGIIHGDDISTIILEWVQAKVKCQAMYDLDSTLVRIWKHWVKSGVEEFIPTNIEGIDKYYLDLYTQNVVQ